MRPCVFLKCFDYCLDGFSCPADTEPLKLKFGQLEIFDYKEGCDDADTTNQNALLGKK